MPLLGTDPRVIRTDVRTPEQTALEQARLGTFAGLSNQYGMAVKDPTYSLPNPEQQQYDENALMDAVYNRTSGMGAGKSGTEKKLANRALTEYRMGLVDRQQKARDTLRNQMLSVLGMGGQPMATQGVPGQIGTLEELTKVGLGKLLGTAGGELGDYLGKAGSKGIQAILESVFGNSSPAGGLSVSDGWGVNDFVSPLFNELGF